MMTMRHHGEMVGNPPAIDHQLVKTWSERYRCGAANSRWRAGPKMKAAMAEHPEWDVLTGIASYWDLESHIFEDIGSVVRKKARTSSLSF